MAPTKWAACGTRSPNITECVCPHGECGRRAVIIIVDRRLRSYIKTICLEIFTLVLVVLDFKHISGSSDLRAKASLAGKLSPGKAWEGEQDVTLDKNISLQPEPVT